MSKLALLFPGQGSQTPGMAAGFRAHPATRELFARADDILGFSLSALMKDGPAEVLTQTENAQPALLLAGHAAYTYLRAAPCTLHPGMATGHSLGFYTAALAAGCFDFDFALQLVRARGLAMSQVTGGGMLAVLGLEADAAQQVATQSGVTLANDNAPGQVIFSGSLKALEKAAATAKAGGAKRTLMLPVSGAFHTPAMRPAAAEVEAILANHPLKNPTMPLLANSRPELLTTAAQVAHELVAQITAPVRWREGISFLVEQGVEEALELGAGTVLTGLMKRCAPAVACTALATPEQIDAWAKND